MSEKNKQIIELKKYKNLIAKDFYDDYKLNVDLLDYYLKQIHINNIGIVGPHSSGKSSIVESYYHNKLSKKEKNLF
ncbi:MAG: hypothetical protein WC225_03520 [Acholeplasmataceae bacterium]|nr:hypothetical protein [Acholeplasmataceae bacterium]